MTTRLETESEEDSDEEPNGITGGGEEESQGASGSSEAEWSGVEWGGGRMITYLDLQRARNTAGTK